jgi:hypothetical protein
MGGTSQANWSSPPPGATLNYTANQTMSNNSNVSSGDWGGYTPGGSGAGGGGPRQANQRSAQESTTQGTLSSSPMPEYWCSILYFEQDTQVINTYLNEFSWS